MGAADAKGNLAKNGGDQVLPRSQTHTAESIVLEWAASLLPANAPSPLQKGPLSWVRGEKVQELLAALKAAGIR